MRINFPMPQDAMGELIAHPLQQTQPITDIALLQIGQPPVRWGRDC
jgi:hypothetical protein